MRLSIIVPVYNVEKFVAKCLDSVISQSYDDYEIIAVNDGSTDHSLDVLKEYASKCAKVRIINQQNKGLGGARNTGIECARGDYLMFLDSDDYIVPDALMKLNQYLTKYSLDILAFDWLRVDINGSTIEQVSARGYNKDFSLLKSRDFMLLEPTSCTKVYRRTLFCDYEIKFPEHLWYEDLATVYRVSAFAEKIGYLRLPLYCYVQQDDSITHSANTKRMMEVITAFDFNLTFYKQHDIYEKFQDELEWNCALHVLYYSAFRLFCNGFHIRKMNQLYNYSKSIFPTIESNKYVLERTQKYDMMDLVMRRHYLRFYLKTGFTIKCYRLLCKIRRKPR